MSYLVRVAFVVLVATISVGSIQAMQSFSCEGGDGNSGCTFPHVLTNEHAQLFDELLAQGSYGEIENILCKPVTLEENGYGSKATLSDMPNIFGHYLVHKSSDYLQEIFDAVKKIDLSPKFSLISGDDGAPEGLLKFYVRRIAAAKYQKNLDQIDTVRNMKERKRRNFDPSQWSEEELFDSKKKYLERGGFPAAIPAFIITLDDLHMHGVIDQELDVVMLVDDVQSHNSLNEILADTSNHWQTLAHFYSLVGFLGTLSYQQLQGIFQNADNTSVLAMVLRFVNAKFHNQNLDGNACTSVVKEIKEHFLSKSKSFPSRDQRPRDQYYGLQVVSDCYPWLPYLIVALFQPDFRCPLIPHTSSQESTLWDKEVKDASGWDYGYGTHLGGYYEFPDKVLLAIKRYMWNEEKECYLRTWQLFLQDCNGNFGEFPVYAGKIWYQL